jgi:sorbitol-specific phosphotransferase system component IIBC
VEVVVSVVVLVDEWVEVWVEVGVVVVRVVVNVVVPVVVSVEVTVLVGVAYTSSKELAAKLTPGENRILNLRVVMLAEIKSPVALMSPYVGGGTAERGRE